MKPRFITVASLTLAFTLLLAMWPRSSAQNTGQRIEYPAGINVREKGARGTGTSDDTAAIQAAINNRHVSKRSGAIIFPAGTYRITKTITIDLEKVGYTSLNGMGGVARIVMAGPGPAFRFVGTHLKSAAPSGFEDKVWLNQRMPMVDGLEIVGDHPEAIGIEADGTMQLTITRSRFQDLLHGIHLANNNRNVLIADCHIYDNRGIGIFYDNVNLHQSNIVGSHISYCGGGGIVTRAGNVRNIHIGTCDIESNHSPDGEPTANILIDSRGGSTGEVAITGCTIQHNSQSPGSANIRIIGPGDDPQHGKTQEGHITIGDNVFSDVKMNIHLQHARGVTITGNTFWMGFEGNLLVEDSSNIVVGPNNMDRNPRYAHTRAETSTGSVVFRRSRDCTISGLHINGAWHDPAAFAVEDCSRFNITGCTILDSDNVGLLLKNLKHSRVSGCLIRDDRDGAKSMALEVTGGEGNQIDDNLLGRPAEIDKASVLADD